MANEVNTQDIREEQAYEGEIVPLPENPTDGVVFHVNGDNTVVNEAVILGAEADNGNNRSDDFGQPTPSYDDQGNFQNEANNPEAGQNSVDIIRDPADTHPPNQLGESADLNARYFSEFEDGSNQRRVGEKRTLQDVHADNPEKWPGWPGDSVFRLIVPVHKVGAIIGRKGDIVRKMCEETRAKIKVLEPYPGANERVVLVYAREEPDNAMPPAVVGLLRVHRQVVEGSGVDPTAPPPPEVLVGTITARLLLPIIQAGSLIGKQGANIKVIQDGSGANIRVLSSDQLPPYALEEDRVVEMTGAVRSVYMALELSLAHLRRFLVDRSVIPLYEKLEPVGVSSRTSHYRSEPAPWSSRSHSDTRSSYPPPEPYYSPHERYEYSAPPQEDFSSQQQAVSLYGRDSEPQSRSVPAAAPPVSVPVVSIKEVTASLQVPLSYADAVIGSNGANILFVRRNSGATVTVQETRSSTGVPEMVVEMRGTTQQVQAAEQLLQSFIATSDAPASAPAPGSGTGSGYAEPSSYSDGYGREQQYESADTQSGRPSNSGYDYNPPSSNSYGDQYNY